MAKTTSDPKLVAALTDALPFPVAVVHPSLEVLYSNTAMVSILGFKAGAKNAKPFPAKVERKRPAEIILKPAKGARRTFELRSTEIRWQRKKAYLVTLQDLTSHFREKDKLTKALHELKFALASEKVLMEELDKKNKELLALSTTDGLTGLNNHRHLMERFEFEFERARRMDTALSCMLIDIDHFKQINDNHGHQFGDFVIREIGKVLKDGSRTVDICGRYGGEEFMVISQLPADHMMKFAARIHRTIEEKRFSLEHKTIHVTVSIGVSGYRHDIKTKEELTEQADQALYQAKRDGRNMIREFKEKSEDRPQPLDQMGIEDLKTQFLDLSHQVMDTYRESALALVKAVDAKDNYTLQHSKNVSAYAVKIAGAMGFSEEEKNLLQYAGLLHDVGKIGIPQDLLTKGNELTDDEFAIVKRYPEIGVNILKDVKFLEKELPVILHHHERFDGSGYPQGLKGREIPVGARILAVADAFDAMTTRKQYGKTLSKENAVKELIRCAGAHFDPSIVNIFVEIIEGSEANTEKRNSHDN